MDRCLVPLLAVLALGAQGCSVRYVKAMVAAEQATEVQDWPSAVVRYGQAREARPQSARAAEMHVLVSQNAADRAMAEARAALAAADYAKVVDRLDYVASLSAIDVPEAFLLRRDAAIGAAAEVEAAWDLRDPRRVYQKALAFRELFPDSQEVGPMFDRVRGHYVQAAEQARIAGEYATAVAAIRTIGELEPEQIPFLVEPMERHIRSTWADALSTEARKEALARRHGAACLLYARAYEVGGRGTDRANALALADRVRADGRFTIAVVARGAGSRVQTLRHKMEQAVATFGEKAQPGEADLTIYVNAPPARCAESASTARKQQEIVKGQVDVPNPQHERVTREIQRADRMWQELEDEANAVQARVETLQAQVATLDVAIEEAKQAIATANLQEEEAKKQVAAAERYRTEQATAVEGLRETTSATRADINGGAAQLENTVSILVEWQAVLKTAERDRREAERTLQNLSFQREPLVAELTTADQQHDTVIAARNELEAKREKLAIQQQVLPPTIRADVRDEVAYEEKTWTRTCETDTYVTMRPRWDSGMANERRLRKQAQTVDLAHTGVAAAGIAPDPKAYGETDQALVAAADRLATAEVLGWFADLTEEHYRVGLEDALASLQGDPRAATTGLLGLYLEAPERFDVDALGEVQRHVVSFGVEDLRTVLSPATATADAGDGVDEVAKR